MHYQNYQFFIPETGAMRTSNSAKFFPKHCKMPAIEPGDTIRLAAQDLIVALRNKHSKAPMRTTPHGSITTTCSNFETVTAVDTPETRVEEPVPRVQEPSTSHDATAPRVLRQLRPVHQCHTRNNTPINLQEENTDDDCTVQTSNVSTTTTCE
jgi:hypothetical protein